MAKYEIGKRYELALTLERQSGYISHYTRLGELVNIYILRDAEGTTFVWKTSGNLGMDISDAKNDNYYNYDLVQKHDAFTCKATVKEFSEYKGEPQIVLTRVKVTSIDHAPTKEERDKAKAKTQLESLAGGDFIWTMPYRQYKEHYADCETLAGSFNVPEYGCAEIKVIIREGRLVPSGVRGQHFHRYSFVVDGVRHTYRAVSADNARGRCEKDYPEAKSIVCDHIYD